MAASSLRDICTDDCHYLLIICGDGDGSPSSTLKKLAIPCSRWGESRLPNWQILVSLINKSYRVRMRRIEGKEEAGFEEVMASFVRETFHTFSASGGNSYASIPQSRRQLYWN